MAPVRRPAALPIVLALTAVLLGCENKKVYISFGQHVDFYHSYRGDTPDEDGFGLDIDVITQTLDILEEHPRVKMSWEFDSWQTLEQRLPTYAPELFDRIKARVAEKDEVRFQAWNGGLVSAETPDEFRASIEWQRVNLVDIFGKVENGVYPQEMMHTPSLIPAYADLGVEWVSLFYSASSFTAFRNEVELNGKELYNPLWLETPAGDARMILLPTYHHADVADFLGMPFWADYVRRTVEGDALIFIAFDADGSSWPVILDLFLRGTEVLPFVEFCTPGEYLAEHDPVGTIVLRRDQADGVFDGYSSWAEKPINHEIWTAVEASRAGERRTRGLMDRFGLSNATVSARLAENFRWRMETLKTTHFGLATPFLHPDRVTQAREHADRIRDLSGQALSLAEAEALPYIEALAGPPPVLPFTGASQAHYLYRTDGGEGAVLQRVPVAFVPGETDTAGLRVYRDGVEVPSGLLDLVLHPDGTVATATVAFLGDLGTEGASVFWISRSTQPGLPEPDYGLLPPGDDVLDSGLVSVAFDADGWPTSLVRDGVDYAAGRLINPGVTYRGAYVGPPALVDDGLFAGARERGFLRERVGRGVYAVPCQGVDVPGAIRYRFRVYAGLPFLEVAAEASFPDLAEPCLEGLTEAFPIGIHPDLTADAFRVWKHNYFEDVGDYDILAPADSVNSHVSASWTALSDRTRGLLVAYDAAQLASLAFCPLQVRPSFFGKLHAVMNPFGTFWGSLPDHDARRTGGNGLGEVLTVLLGEQFKPVGAAYGGAEASMAVVIAPYGGDAPPAEERAQAEAYSYPPGHVALAAP